MTQLQREILTYLAAAKQPEPAGFILDHTSLADRRHQCAPNGNGGGGDWRPKTIGAVLAGMRKRGWVRMVDEWPKTWEITDAGREAVTDGG